MKWYSGCRVPSSCCGSDSMAVVCTKIRKVLVAVMNSIQVKIQGHYSEPASYYGRRKNEYLERKNSKNYWQDTALDSNSIMHSMCLRIATSMYLKWRTSRFLCSRLRSMLFAVHLSTAFRDMFMSRLFHLPRAC